MKKWLCGACCILLAGAAALTPMALRDLPWRGDGEQESAYAGAVRLWAWQGLRGGAGWIDDCAARFQRANPGVYIHVDWRSEAEMKMCASGEIDPPDGALFPGGMLESAEGLAPISGREDTWIPPSPYALPVAMSGYLWCGDGGAANLVCPPDDDRRCYCAALLCACARRGGTIDRRKAGEGMDLGLSTPPPRQEEKEKVSFALSALARTEDAAALLHARRAEAAMLTRRDWARMPSRPDARAVGEPFTDLVVWYAAPQGPNPGRMDAARAFGSFLLTDACQSRLTAWGLVPTARGLSLYAADPAMGSLEQSLSSPDLITPPPFSNAWHRTAQRLWDLCLAGQLDPWDGVERLREAMGDGGDAEEALRATRPQTPRQRGQPLWNPILALRAGE